MRSEVMQVKKVLTREEMNYFLKKSNWRGFYEVFFSWGLIGLSFAIVALWPHTPTIFLPILIALYVLGGRHLGLAILVHDASHRSLFKTKRLNDFMGEWFAAAPIMQNLEMYRKYHLQHHNYTGERYQGDVGDPDLLIVRFYPLRGKTLRKWLRKDLLGRTALNLYTGLFLMIVGKVKFDLSGRVTRLEEPKRSWLQKYGHYTKALFPFFFTNGILLSTLLLTGYGWLYLLWIISALTTHSVFIRIRAISEHGMLEKGSNYLVNTRTTKARWYERLSVAPHFVNYHIEHHLLMTVPGYKLPKLHKILTKRKVLENANVAKSYFEVLRLAGSQAA